MIIREASLNDLEGVWEIFEQVIKTGDTYAFDPDSTKEDLPKLWFAPTMRVFVAEEDDKILGTYFIKPNQVGLGAHVANCGYMVHPDTRGRGLGKQLCEHSLLIAKENGFKGMQFNFVVSTNTTAVKLWQNWVSASSAPFQKALITGSWVMWMPILCSRRLVRSLTLQRIFFRIRLSDCGVIPK